MRALIRSGNPKTLSFTTDFLEPTPEEFADHYIIRTKTTALTRGELTWPEPLIPQTPIPGFDLAGIIEQAPTKPANRSNAYKPGDEVYALSTFSWQGNAKEITVATEEELALKPKNVNWEEAASVPLSALSAWQALFVHAKLQPPSPNSPSANKGKRVLITAASGGVGIWGVQLAHLAGIEEVVATCGTSNVEFVKSLGADTVLDYRKIDVLEWVSVKREERGFDVILDCIGGQTLTDVWKCARKGGRVISVAEPPDPKKPADGIAEGVESTWYIVTANGEQLTEITKLIEERKVNGVVDSVYMLEEYKEAFERLEGGHARGKVVLKVA
ncbi:zinc-binding oxidoreductase [Lophiotrema nucula]|uniref:Zinc-binding oxidoreductase n=1 Tax=Lophiotrema nucula TaxID=690887 RepID=A0A6A5ZUN1_9PLEO|nr:zinc-binding oxidoreductase [Lophiotrema nucula]